MALWTLLNDTQVGSNWLRAGETVNDAVRSIALIQGAGGVLIPQGDAQLATAAANVQFLKRRGNSAIDALAAQQLIAAMLLSPQTLEHYARGVVTANVANLAAFTVAGNDGLTYAAGQKVLLVGQTTASQNGLYFVNTVAGTTAPLTRASDWLTGASLPPGTVVEISEGTTWANSQWKTTSTGVATVDTTSVTLFPRQQRGTSAAMTAGTITISNVWLLAGATINLTENTSGGTVGTLKAPSASRTTGAGTGSFVITSSSGTDTSTVDWQIFNC